MNLKSIIVSGLVLAVLGSAAGAFEEQKMKQQAAPVGGSTAGAATSGSSGAALSNSGIAPPRLDTGTKIRVPGLGVIGEIPKMDFGLELLYGASQPKQPSNDDSQPSGVMGRVTVPLKSPR